MEHVHVIPDGDYLEHDLSLLCVCGPTEELDFFDQALIVTHIPWDGRHLKDPNECDCVACREYRRLLEEQDEIEEEEWEW